MPGDKFSEAKTPGSEKSKTQHLRRLDTFSALLKNTNFREAEKTASETFLARGEIVAAGPIRDPSE